LFKSAVRHTCRSGVPRHWHASAFTGTCNDLAAASACA
ncbi:hypothetical protein, partial [Escherichia coli]